MNFFRIHCRAGKGLFSKFIYFNPFKLDFDWAWLIEKAAQVRLLLLRTGQVLNLLHSGSEEHLHNPPAGSLLFLTSLLFLCECRASSKHRWGFHLCFCSVLTIFSFSFWYFFWTYIACPNCVWFASVWAHLPLAAFAPCCRISTNDVWMRTHGHIHSQTGVLSQYLWGFMLVLLVC